MSRAVVVALALVAVACRRPTSPPDAGVDGGSPPLARASIDVDGAGAQVPDDFVGLSMEYGKSLHNALGHTKRPNRGFVRLLQNLPPSVLRIGGNSTDESCFEGLPAPAHAGCLIAVTADELDLVARVAKETGWRFILGVNLAQGSPEYGAAYARQIAARVPREAIEALEIGNEPDMYPTHAFRGTSTMVRPTAYGVHEGAREYRAFADAIKKDAATRDLPLAGPALASKWAKEMKSAYLPEVGASRIDLVTTHHYPLSACRDDRKPDDPRYPTLEHLLAPKTMERLSAAIALDVDAARALDKPLEVDETNSISCRGTAGVSDTFAAASWGIDYFFTAAELGVARLNLHGGSETARYSPITPAEKDGAFENVVHPLYYAMLLFARAEGGRLVPVRLLEKRANVKAWAVAPKCDAPCPALRVFLVNKDEQEHGAVRVEPSRRMGRAEAVLLRAPSIDSKEDTTLGGHSIDAATGEIAPPDSRAVLPDASGAYTVDLDVADVAMLSIEN